MCTENPQSYPVADQPFSTLFDRLHNVVSNQYQPVIIFTRRTLAAQKLLTDIQNVWQFTHLILANHDQRNHHAAKQN